MPVTLEQFVAGLASSGLMTAGEAAACLADFRRRAKPQDSPYLAQELVRQGKLTRYQAAQLYHGAFDSLLLADYLILEKIGAGGMGQVFKARQRSLGRLVALKVLPPAATKSPELVKRFQREVRAAAQLSHANIVASYDAGEHQGVHYLAMEYVDGGDLSSVVRKHGVLSVEHAVDCVIQAGRGLEHAHSKGIIHRDIKPSNLLINRSGVVKVLDMGLARFEQSLSGANETLATEGLTDSGMIMGTVDFMSPEQALDVKRADNRSDIYSLGCTLFYLLTGRRMYEGDSVMRKVVAHRKAPIPSIRELRLEVPEQLEAVFQKMVAKRPADRWNSAGETCQALESCLVHVHVGQPAHRGNLAELEDTGLAMFLSRVSSRPRGVALGDTVTKIAESTPLPATSIGNTLPRPLGQLSEQVRWWWSRPAAKYLVLGLLALAVSLTLAWLAAP